MSNDLELIKTPVVSVTADITEVDKFNADADAIIEALNNEGNIIVEQLNANNIVEIRKKASSYELLEKRLKLEKSKLNFGVVTDIQNKLDLVVKTCADFRKSTEKSYDAYKGYVFAESRKKQDGIFTNLKQHKIPCIIELPSVFEAKERELLANLLKGKKAEEYETICDMYINALPSKIDNINKIIEQNIENYKFFADFEFDRIDFDYLNPQIIDFASLKQDKLAKIKAIQDIENSKVLQNEEIIEHVEKFPNLIPEKEINLQKFEGIKDTTKMATLNIEVDGESYKLNVPVPLDCTLGEIVSTSKLAILKLLSGK
jgi:hypothetical protein